MGFWGFLGWEFKKHTYLNGFLGFFGFWTPQRKFQCRGFEISKLQNWQFNFLSGGSKTKKTPKTHLNMCLSIVTCPKPLARTTFWSLTSRNAWSDLWRWLLGTDCCRQSMFLMFHWTRTRSELERGMVRIDNFSYGFVLNTNQMTAGPRSCPNW